MGLFLAAAGTLALEILLTRVFSVVMWYHFASMAIAIAMFGLAWGGLLPYLFRRARNGSPGEDRKERFGELPPATCSRLAAGSALFAASPYAVLLAFARYPLWGGKLLSVFHQPYFEPFRTAARHAAPAGDALQIGLLLFLFSLPFAGAGAVFAMAFSRRAREGTTYAAVMGGSAAGVVAYLAAMRAGSGPAAFLFVSALFSLSAAAFAASSPAGAKTGKGRVSVAPVLFLAMTAMLLAAGVFEVRHGYAEIRFVRGRFEPDLLWTRWDALSRVAVYPVSGDEASKAWGVSPAYSGPVPAQIGMVVDDTGYTALFGTGKDPEALEAFGSNVASLPYRIRGSGKALVIGPGGGKDILCALASGRFDVTAVEVNPLVVRAADREFGDFTGMPYRMPGVRSVVAEGRLFLASDRSKYDVIQMTQVFGRMPPSAGAFTMTEDHLYTVEAFRGYLSRLSEGGIVSVTRFVHERRVWRILAMAREALLRMGEEDPVRHVLAFRDRGLVNILVRRTPWPPEEIASARRLSEELRFPLMLAPDIPPAGLPGTILAGTHRGEEGPYDFSPPTDDRPFFYYTLRPRAFLPGVSGGSAEFDDRAVALLRGFLASAAALCAAFLLVPGAILARAGPGRPSVSGAAFMFCAGAAFIVWEIVMIRKLLLLLGAPALSLAAGLTMILASAGAGGYLAGRRGAAAPGAGFLLAAVAASAYLFLAGETISRWSGAASGVRLLAAAAYVFPPSLVMGRFFPVGLRVFSGPGGTSAPFYFAANGAASVMGAALAQALALNLGYRATTAFGAVLYLCCAVLLLRAGKGAGTTRPVLRPRSVPLSALAAVAALSVLLPGCSRSAGTVEGRATEAGKGAPGAEVQFFVKPGEERSGTPFAVRSAGPDGAFRVELPAGMYYVVARTTVREGARDRVYKGEYPGNPVRVESGGAVRGIEVPLAEMSSGGFVPQENTGVRGVVASAGKPVEGAYVFAYPEDAGTIRGPSYVAFARTDEAGRFHLPLRGGSFRVVARRKGGENETGAMGKGGDGSGGFAVSLAPGTTRDLGAVALHAPEETARRRRAEAGGQESARSELRGTVVRDDGSPVPGLYVMAFADHRMIGRPFAISGRSEEDGSFVLHLPRPGRFYIGARSEFGGPLSPGEWVGTYDGAPDHAVAVREGEMRQGIRIRVVEKW